jgi:hypothetical protein
MFDRAPDRRRAKGRGKANYWVGVTVLILLVAGTCLAVKFMFRR